MSVPESWTRGTVRANGTELGYYRTGEGPPLVAAHGFYDDGRRWAPVFAALADAYDCVAYDARGHGRSAAPDAGYGIDDRVADLVGVVEALALDDPILLGHSMGGSTVARTAAAHPALPRAIVLEEPAAWADDPPAGPDRRAEWARERITERRDRPVEDLVAAYAAWDDDQARRLAAADRACDPAVAAVARHGYPPVADALADVACPTLVVLGGEARSTEAAARARRSVATAADRRLVRYPDAGHYVFRDAFDAAVAELASFLAGP